MGNLSKRISKLPKTLRFLLFLSISVFFLFGAYLVSFDIKHKVQKKKEQEAHVDWLEKSVVRLEKRIHDFEKGGGDDRWFEKNAMDRTGQDENLLKKADYIGLKHIRKTSLKYGDHPDAGVTGYYINEGYGVANGYPIIIRRGLSDNEEKRTLAHEYIHYIYHNSYVSVKDQDLFKGLLLMYSSNLWFLERMIPYIKDSSLTIDELLAISCTEIPDRDMNPYVLRWCNNWIDRSKIVMAY